MPAGIAGRRGTAQRPEGGGGSPLGGRRSGGGGHWAPTAKRKQNRRAAFRRPAGRNGPAARVGDCAGAADPAGAQAERGGGEAGGTPRAGGSRKARLRSIRPRWAPIWTRKPVAFGGLVFGEIPAAQLVQTSISSEITQAPVVRKGAAAGAWAGGGHRCRSVPPCVLRRPPGFFFKVGKVSSRMFTREKPAHYYAQRPVGSGGKRSVLQNVFKVKVVSYTSPEITSHVYSCDLSKVKNTVSFTVL